MESPATTELLSRYRPIREHNKSSSREILFPKGKKISKHTRGRSPYRKCPPCSLDRDETSYASSNSIDKHDTGKVFNGRRDRGYNNTGLEKPIVEPFVKEIDSQEIPDGEDEEYLSEGGGNEPEEFMPPPGSDVHTFIGKQDKTYVHRPGPERNGEILRDLFYEIKSTDKIRGYTFLIGFALAWGRKKKKIELVVKQ
jgi:hypothetical protein